MRHALQIGHHRISGNVLAEDQRKRRRLIGVDLGAQDLRQAYDLPARVRYLEPHQAFAGNRLDDPDAHHRQRPGKVLYEIDDLAALDAHGRLDLITGNDRSGISGYDFHLDTEIEQLLLDQPGREFQGIRAQNLQVPGRLIEQANGRQQRVGKVLEQRHLLFALDARRSRNLDRLRFDAKRLVNLQLLELFLHDLLTFDRSLLARPAVFPLFPLAKRKEVGRLDPCAELFNDVEPGNAGEQAKSCRKQHQQNQCPPCKTQGLGQAAANYGAQNPAGFVRKCHLERVQPGRFDPTARQQHDDEANHDYCVRPAVGARRMLDTMKPPPNQRPAENDPPVCRQPEDVEHDIGKPGSHPAAGVVHSGNVSAMRPTGVLRVVGIQNEREIKGKT